jgi:modulator of FtsH protease HflK
MAWNEPGGGKRDPWKGNQKGNDVEETLKRLRDGVGRLFGGGGGGTGAGSILAAVLGIALLWAVYDSIVSINARDVGVVLRFGEFSRLLPNGINLKWPRPIEQVVTVEMTKVRSVNDHVSMLTTDENIVQIDFNVQYLVTDARKYLFKLREPVEETLKQAAESAVRQVIGAHEMDTILSGAGAELVSDTKKILQSTLDSYESGLQVTEVNFQSVAPPLEVKESFDDVNSAREDKQRIENEAQAYSNKVVPEARGEAAKIKAEAEAYKAERIARAEGDSQRFGLLYGQYKAAPEVTRKRLYLETLQQVLGSSLKVLDQSNGKSLIYLPLDKLKGGAEFLGPVTGAAVTEEARPRGGQP